MAGRTIEDKVSDTLRVFEVLRAELTPAVMRTTLAELKMLKATELQSYMELAAGVMANDRAAMIAAATLVTTGVARPDPWAGMEDAPDGTPD